jgi:hypothetical protein
MRQLDIDQVQLGDEKAVVALNVEQVAVNTKKMREERKSWRLDMLALERKRVKERKVCPVFFVTLVLVCVSFVWTRDSLIALLF